MARILVIDDEQGILSVLYSLLTANKYDVTAEKDGLKAKKRITSEHFDLMISDMRMTPIDGLQLLKHAREQKPDMPVLMLTAYGSKETAEEAMNIGAFGYLLKPFNLRELLFTVRKALEEGHRPEDTAERAAEIEEKPYNLEDIIAESQTMKDICKEVKRIASGDNPILITGEVGTGKKLLARAIHGCSSRASKPFIVQNCAIFPEPLLKLEMFGYMKGAFAGAKTSKEGILEEATTGTALFDEIAWMPLTLQKNLCEALKERAISRVNGNEHIPIDARVIGTTNLSFDDLLKEGKVLEELYEIFKDNWIVVKPLRERPEDIMPMVYDMLKNETDNIDAGWTIDEEAQALLKTYSWPRNGTELAGIIKRLVPVAEGNRITADILPTGLKT